MLKKNGADVDVINERILWSPVHWYYFIIDKIGVLIMQTIMP